MNIVDADWSEKLLTYGVKSCLCFLAYFGGAHFSAMIEEALPNPLGISVDEVLALYA